MLRPVAAFAASATLLLWTASAPAATAAPPRSAEAFVEAFTRAEAAVTASVPVQRRRTDEVLRTCAIWLKPEPPEELWEDAMALFTQAVFQETLFVPLTAPVGQLVADLDAIPTRDPVLRSARAVWRTTYDTLLRAPRMPDACADAAAWRAAGWARSARPALPPESDPLSESSLAQDRARDRRLAVAARRLRALGVARERAELVEGERLLDATDPISDVLG